jgi:hypothetical protein
MQIDKRKKKNTIPKWNLIYDQLQSGMILKLS